MDISGAFNSIERSIGYFVTMNLIQLRDGYLRKRRRIKPGKTKVSLVNIQQIIQGDEKFIEALKKTVVEDLYKVTDSNLKYTFDLFYIAPLFQKKFSKLERMIFLDIDLMFQDNIKKLWNQFPKTAELGEKCIGVGKDLSPHYWHM